MISAMTYRGATLIVAFGVACFQCIATLAELPGDPNLLVEGLLVNRADVRKELEFVDDQILAFQQGLEADRKKARESEKQLDRLPLLERGQRALQVLHELQEGKRKLRQEVLLPHQVQRLTELRWRYRSIDDPIRTFDQAVELTDEQVAQMRATELELHADLYEKLRSFHLRSQREILEVLTPEQRAQWEELSGEDFEFRSSRHGLKLLHGLSWGGGGPTE
jgi:hypothetical protein